MRPILSTNEIGRLYTFHCFSVILGLGRIHSMSESIWVTIINNKRKLTQLGIHTDKRRPYHPQLSTQWKHKIAHSLTATIF